jgi:hypothetical protein
MEEVKPFERTADGNIKTSPLLAQNARNGAPGKAVGIILLRTNPQIGACDVDTLEEIIRTDASMAFCSLCGSSFIA